MIGIGKMKYILRNILKFQKSLVKRIYNNDAKMYT